MRGTVAPDEPLERTIPPGFHLEWQADPKWRLVSSRAQCRRMGDRKMVCPNTAVAELDRGVSRPRWYTYCAEHLYGRRIHEGVVEYQVLVEDAPHA